MQPLQVGIRDHTVLGWKLGWKDMLEVPHQPIVGIVVVADVVCQIVPELYEACMMGPICFSEGKQLMTGWKERRLIKLEIC